MAHRKVTVVVTMSFSGTMKDGRTDKEKETENRDSYDLEKYFCI